MAAADTPMDWSWPPPSLPSSSRLHLEHQFLPLAPRSSSSWGDDPAHLQQLMMGSSRARPSLLPPPPPPAAPAPSTVAVAVAPSSPPSSSSAGRPSSNAARDLAAVLDLDANKPLPSGWERCLDLKSGEVFIVKSASNVNAGVERQSSLQENWKESTNVVKAPKKLSGIEPRQDWSLGWLQGIKTAKTSEVVISSSGKGYRKEDGGVVKIAEKEGRQDNIARQVSQETEPLGLDLDLKLTSEKPAVTGARKASSQSDATDIMKAFAKRQRVDLSQGERFRPSMNPSSTVAPAATVSAKAAPPPPPAREEKMLQQWNWQPRAADRKSIQEVATESTMATAVCSKCLMYVLLRKSNPTCPRCSNPIILDCPLPRSSKRSRLELTPDDLSLSTQFRT